MRILFLTLTDDQQSPHFIEVAVDSVTGISLCGAGDVMPCDLAVMLGRCHALVAQSMPVQEHKPLDMGKSISTQAQISLSASAITIGNFDGVHLGHKAMLTGLARLAAQQQLERMVMIFEPQPREYFALQKGRLADAPARITNLPEKLALFALHGVDTVVVARFNEAFRQLSAQQFADLLYDQLQVRAALLGDDFRFGHDRTGDSAFLRQFGFVVQTLATVSDQGQKDERISSTRIRDCLLTGDLTTAKKLLGRDYSITGVVQHGDKLGRTLDFPTANIALDRLKPALHGVFAVSVESVDGTDLSALATGDKKGVPGLTQGSLFGACNVGTRPALRDQGYGVEWRCEVFFPEFAGDLYGQTLTVTFLQFLHGERQYEGLEALKAGIKQDVVDLLNWREDWQQEH